MQGISIFQAFALILTGALNPGALAVSAVFLGRDRGARLENAFLIGGLIMSLVVGGVVVVLVRTTGLELPKNTTPRYDVRLGVASSCSSWRCSCPGCSTCVIRKKKGNRAAWTA